jgi:transcriptional regulator with XRE-family HTH domain
MNKALRIAIINSGLRQYDVAKRVGVGEARMSGFVHGRFEPTQDEKKRIAKVLKVAVHDLFQSESAVA